MARPNFARYFDIIDDNEQHQKRRRILSLRELLIATVSLLVGAALMLATLNWDDGPCLPSGSMYHHDYHDLLLTYRLPRQCSRAC
jgi:hypothetical protein